MYQYKLFLLSLITLPLLSFGQNYTMEYGDNLKYSRIAPNAIDNIRTIEFWFKLDSNYSENMESPQALIQREDQSGLEQDEFGINLVDFIGREGHLEFQFNENRIKSDQNFWRADNWYHAAGVIDSIGGMKLYILGVEQLESDPYTEAIYLTSDTTFIGTWGFKRYRSLKGQIDELRLWNRALSQDEIVENMCRGVDTNQADGLVAYYKFKNGQTDTAYDFSGNGYHILVDSNAWNKDITCYVDGMANLDPQSPFEINRYENSIEVKNIRKSFQSKYSIQLYDISGRLIFQESNINSNTYLINTDGFHVGVGILRVVGQNQITSQKVLLGN